MLGFLTKYVSMRVVWVLIACAVAGVAGAANAVAPVVTVAPLLLKVPSTEETTTALGSMGTSLTDPRELLPGNTLYLEIWFQSLGPNGIASALLNIEYETALLNTSVDQITVASPWIDLWAPVRSVNDAMGLITDVGGISVVGRGLQPQWAKLATIEFNVIRTPDVIAACTLDGGPGSGFGMVGIGAVEEVDYGCACVMESSLGTLGMMVTCLSGPNGTVSWECTCVDIDQDMHVDLADFAAFQVAFRGG